MKKVQLLINKKNGFSLVELLVSISVFLIFVIAFSNTTGSINKASRNSFNRERATVLAEEGLEAVRNIRDNNFINLVDGTHGLSQAGDVWSLSGSSDLTDIFTRVLNISTINDNQKKVDVTITWADQNSPTNSVTSSTYFTNWRSILNVTAGLTVNKTVTNHGGTKVADDFAPYKVSTTILSGDPPEPVVVDTPITIGVASTLNEGTYTITENTDSDYIQTFSGDCDSSGVISLVGDTVNTCLITNEEKPSNLIVTKIVINHSGSKVVSDFTLLVDSNPVVSGVTNVFNSGIHTVSEVVDASYTSTITGDCDVDGLVTLTPGTTKNCTITNEEKLPPSVTTTSPVTSITQITAIGGGNITSDGGATVSVSGLVWSTAINPTTADNKTTDGWALGGPWTSTMTGLTCNTLYHVRAYATNIIGTSYGSDVTFTTGACNVIPTVTTPTSTSITTTTATLGANVTSLGIPALITARGTCWGTTPAPITNCVAEGGTTTGVFTQARTGFARGTTYYYRGYATNATGTAYSADGTFTTLTSNITFVGANSANTTTVTIPAHNVGDLLVMFAYRNSSNAPPTVPSGWTTINSAGGASNSSALAYRIATGSDTSGSWSNASQLIVQVYRGIAASPIGGFGTHQAANSKIVTYPAVTMSVTDGSSWIIGSAGAANITSNVQNPPTGMTIRANPIGASSEVAGFDTSGGVSSWTAKTVTISGSNVKWSARTLEIKSN